MQLHRDAFLHRDLRVVITACAEGLNVDLLHTCGRGLAASRNRLPPHSSGGRRRSCPSTACTGAENDITAYYYRQKQSREQHSRGFRYLYIISHSFTFHRALRPAGLLCFIPLKQYILNNETIIPLLDGHTAKDSFGASGG